MPEPAPFGLRLRELREAANVSREELAERAGLSGQAIRDIEQGRREPLWATAVAIADALDVSLDELREAAGPLGPPKVGRPKKKTEVKVNPEPKRPATKRKPS